MTDKGYTRQYKYQEGLSFEAVITNFIGHIAQWRVKDPKMYASGIETLILMCPTNFYEKGIEKLSELGLQRCEYQGINQAKMRLYDDLWRFMNKILEENNLIYRTSYIKTYE
ncbi:MAG: hypothetical protein GF350_12010 [Chitinivibrionales bacterium]|nr:hypothetical protein [Chitinivibrionales bacterium]